MPRQVLGKCPVCGQTLEVTRLSCSNCETTIEGHFEVCKLCQLSNEQKQFIEIFIKSRGNIREVERELGISYPTVRSRLDAVIQALGYRVDSQEEPEMEGLQAGKRKEVLESLQNGLITPDEAIKLLKQR